MTNAKHTPGPWEFVHRYSDQQMVMPMRLVQKIGKESGDCIIYHDAKWPITDANARLIAAAPELLEALQDAHPFISDDALRTRIGNIIVKARGE